MIGHELDGDVRFRCDHLLQTALGPKQRHTGILRRRYKGQGVNVITQLQLAPRRFSSASHMLSSKEAQETVHPLGDSRWRHWSFSPI